MDLTRDTRVGDILEKYPWLKDELIKMDDRFRVIEAPMADKVMKKATLDDASGMFGMSVEEMIGSLGNMIEMFERRKAGE